MEIDFKKELKDYLSSNIRVSCADFVEYLISGIPEDKELKNLLDELLERDIYL